MNDQTPEQRIEDGIRRSIHHMTPDLIDSLVSELDLASENACETEIPHDGESFLSNENLTGGKNLAARQVQINASKTPETPQSNATRSDASATTQSCRPRRWYRLALSVAAFFAFVAVGLFALSSQDHQAFAVVDLDVNPSVELSIDNHERVITVEALNDDAIIVLDGLKLDGTDLNTACHAIIGSMLVKGFLRADSNSILVSIHALDPQVGKQLEQRISQNLNSYLENSEVAVAILGQYVAEDEEASRIASEQGVSLGKAWLVRKILAVDPRMDEASLLKLSAHDLILLAQEKNVNSDTSIGTSDTTAFISKDKAVEIALENAGVQKQDARQIQVEFDCENGELVYEVEFYAASNAYEYEINTRSGQIVSTEVNAIEAANQTQDDSNRHMASHNDDDEDVDFDDDDDDDDDNADGHEEADFDNDRDDADSHHENDDDDQYDMDDDDDDDDRYDD